MPRYRVTLTGPVYEYAELVVDAPDPDAAEEAGWTALREETADSALRWEICHDDIGDASVVDAEPV